MSQRICDVESCKKPHHAGGLCGMHRWRLRVHGSLDLEQKPRRTCTVGDCTEPHKGQGMCAAHHRRDYYAKNRERELAGMAEWRQVNYEHDRERWTEWASRRACSRCGKRQPRSEFSPSNSRKDGLHSWCKTCCAGAARERNRTQEGIARTAARHAALKSDPEYQAIRKRAYDRWRQENPDASFEATRRWRKANETRVRAYSHARKARLLRASDPDRPVDLGAVLARHGMVCHLCGEPISSMKELHFDHVIPLAKNGPHVEENLRPSHALCNLRKGDRIA